MKRAFACGSFIISALFPFAMLAYQIAISHVWVPDWPNETIRFLNYHMPTGMLWFHNLAILELLWSSAFLAAVVQAARLKELFGQWFVPALLAVQVLGVAVMIASPFPMDSDQFAYAYYGDLTDRHINPYPEYKHPLNLTAQEARMAVHWDNPPYVDRYGPAWTLANAAVLRPIVNAPAEFQARVLRIATSLAAIGCTILLLYVLPPVAWRSSALVAFALNPLVIVAAGNGGHNDFFLLFFGLLAWLLAQRRFFECAAAALATAVCVKFAYAPLLPALLAFTWASSRSFVRVASTAAAFGAVVVLYGSPLGFTASFVDPVIGWNAQHPPHISYYFWRAAAHLPHLHGLSERPFATVVPFTTVAVSLAIAYFALRKERRPTLELTLAVLVLLLPYKIENWYGIMLVPLLLVQARFALTMFVSLTLACQFLQLRIFLPASEPYVYFTAIAIIVAVIVHELPVTRDEPRVQSARKESSVLI